ncbi:hypothetical protein SAMN05877831_1215 [Rhodobacter maris]|uniref:DDE family transposase n=1 Tax=Rhodobacter maris TaxID=446682 RepID=A0A285TG47_9RHOB|nr:hypothetical protein SAMN05877831_1215 [Rhodobacter maris]
MAIAARNALHREDLHAIADKGYFSGPEILACHKAGITTTVPRPATSGNTAMFHPSMKAKMDGLEAERTQLEAPLAATPAPDPIALHPGLADVYRQKVSTLAASLSDDATRPEAIALLRGLISEIRLHPDAGTPGGHVIELYGELGSILSLGAGTKAKPRLGVGGVSGSMVAGAGNRRQLPLPRCRV